MAYELKVGQKLWLVMNYNRITESEVVVERVGRKWAYIGRGERISIEDLFVDRGSYSSNGRCYLTKEIYRDEQALEHNWSEIQQQFQSCYRVPVGITAADIPIIRSALKMPAMKSVQKDD